MRKGSMFFLIWDFTVLKPRMTEKKSNFTIKVFLLKRGYENKWLTKGKCIWCLHKFSQLFKYLYGEIVLENLYADIGDILVLGTTKCRCRICRWYYFNQDHELLFHSYGVNTCPVCLEGLVGRDPVKMPCSHVICLPCISEWTSQERSCPMCKQQIPEDFRIQSTKIIRLDFFS